MLLFNNFDDPIDQLYPDGLGNFSVYYYRGLYNYVPTEWETISSITIIVAGVYGNVSGKTLVLRIWTVDGENLDTQVGASDGVPCDNGWIGYEPYNEVSFSFSVRPELLAGVTYAITLDVGGIDASNFVDIQQGYCWARLGVSGIPYTGTWRSNKTASFYAGDTFLFVYTKIYGDHYRAYDPFGDGVLQVVCQNVVKPVVLHEGNPYVRITAHELIRSVHGGVGTITYGIRYGGYGSYVTSTDPRLAYIDVEDVCDNLGTMSFDVQVSDGATTSVTDTQILMQDNAGIC